MGSWKSSWNCQKQLPTSLFCKSVVWCNWWPTDWSVHFPTMSDRWYLCQLFAQTRWQMYYQHDEAPLHFSQVVRQYLNHKFPNWWIGCGGSQNWPPWSLGLNPLDYHVWGYMKAMVYAHKVLNTREELLQRILSAARSINNAAVLHRVTGSLATRVRKCIQADGGHFE